MDQPPPAFDICILCALFEEANALFEEFSSQCATTFLPGWSRHDRYEYRWTTIVNQHGEPLTVAVSWLPRPGPIETARDLKGLLQEFRPRFVAMTGICAGFQERVHLGDLVVASAAYHYEEGKIVSRPDGQSIQQHEPLTESPTDLVLQTVQGFRGWQEPVADLQRRFFADAPPPQCHIGAMASGMAVRADEPFVRLRQQHRNTIALDMEAASFYHTLRAFPTIHALVVKGVCDYASPQKDDRYHDYAARASARYLLTFLQTVVTQQIMPRQTSPTSYTPSERPLVDMSEAPHVTDFVGRQDELAILRRWLADHQCHLIVLLGVGGIGKTSLAARAVDQVSQTFQAIFWYSLLNAPPLERFLHDCLRFLTQEQASELPHESEAQLRLLFTLLSQQRCLVVLDNVDTILQSGERMAEYRDGYEEYETFLRRFGESRHQSCLLVTSREQVKVIARLEGTSVRSYHVRAMKDEDARTMLERKGVTGDKASWQRFMTHASGNPLMLLILAATLRESFRGHIAPYLVDLGDQSLREHPDLRLLLDRQFERFALLEQQVMYWLALKRVALSLQEIREASLQLISKGQVLMALEALSRRSWIEKSQRGSFTLQPALMDAVIDRFNERLMQEILDGRTNLLASHPLMEAQANSFLRVSQCQLVLKVIVRQLTQHLTLPVLEERLRQRLIALRHLPEPPDTYEAGNILNALIQLGTDLQGIDCSRLVIRQAYLAEVDLPEVNFAGASLATSVFSDTFGGILSVAFSPQGNSLAASTATGEIRIWDARNGLPLQTLRGHADWIWSVAFSPDGHLLASSSGDHTVRMWDVSSGLCLAVLRGHTEGVWSVAFAPDGQTIASGGEDQTIRLWNVRSGQCVRVLAGHTNAVRSVTFHPAGRLLASGSSDQTVRLWDVSSGLCLTILEGHASTVRSVAFHPAGELLASGSSDQTIRLWEGERGHCTAILRGHTEALRSVAFSPDGNQLASSGFDRTIRLWAVEHGRCTTILDGHTNAIWSITFAPDGQTLASGSEDQTVRLWEISSNQCLHTLRGSSHGAWSVAFAPTGETLACGCSDGVIRMWEGQSGRCIATLRGHTDGIWAVTFNPDGRILASTGADHTIRLWDVSSRKCLHILTGHTSLLFSVAFSPDGRILASGSTDHTVRLWDVSSGLCLAVLRGHTETIRSVAFHPNGSVLASGSKDHTIRLWNCENGACLAILHGHEQVVSAVAFSPDGQLLASGSKDQTVRLWQTDTSQPLATLKGHEQWVFCIAFSPDGQTLASGSGDQTLRLWDVHSAEPLATLHGHTNAVRSVAFHPDGETVVSGSYDGQMILWKRSTGERLRTWQSHQPYVGMNIAGVKGLTGLQKSTLRSLGAIDDQQPDPGHALLPGEA